MTPNNETYKTFQSLILASEGKTLEDELGFGCRIKYLDDLGNIKISKITHEKQTIDDNISYHKMNVNHLRKFNKKVFTSDSVCEFEVWDTYGVVDTNVEILGKDIGLERVLRALEKESRHHIRMWIDENNLHITLSETRVSDEIEYADWDLKFPAHLQGEETLLKLIEILS